VVVVVSTSQAIKYPLPSSLVAALVHVLLMCSRATRSPGNFEVKMSVRTLL
jgi:hypothetical protein